MFYSVLSFLFPEMTKVPFFRSLQNRCSISQNSHENAYTKVSFQNKVTGLQCATLLRFKRNSGSGVALWTCPVKFLETAF